MRDDNEEDRIISKAYTTIELLFHSLDSNTNININTNTYINTNNYINTKTNINDISISSKSVNNNTDDNIVNNNTDDNVVFL